MRLEDLADYFRLRRQFDNAWQIVRFRKRQRPAEILLARLRGRGAVLRIRGGTSDLHVFLRIFARDEYRLHALGRGEVGCIVDLGANVGYFTVQAALRARQVIAYEPEPHNHAELQHNTAVFPHVVTVRAAVAGSSGQLVLYRARSSVSHSLYQRAEADASAACEPVQAISLDELFAEHQIERCDLLKLDIEGAEYEVIYGASERTLARVARLAAEYHDPRPDDPAARGRALADYLHQHGFAVRLVPRPRHRNKGRLYAVRAGAG